MHTYKTIRCLSFRGKFLYAVLYFFYALTSFFFRKLSLKYSKDFEENPIYFKLIDSLYLGYKYYFEQPERLAKHTSVVASEEFVINPQPVSETVTLSLGGDMMPYDIIHPKNCKYLWDEIGSFYFDSDIVFANLETPIVTAEKRKKVPEIMLNHMLFNASENQFRVFNGMDKQGYQLDVVSTANNHSLDMGLNGIEKTMEFLKQQNILSTGTYTDNSKSGRGVIIERQGIKFGFVSFTYSINHLDLGQHHLFAVNYLRLNRRGVDLSSVKKQVDELKKQGAQVIIGSFHMGNAYQPYPSLVIRENAHRLVQECGIDVLACTHPHNPQPFEFITVPVTGKQALIIYSLADFVAYDVYTFCKLSWTFRLSFNVSDEVNLVKTEVLPFYNMLDKSKHLHFIPIDIVKGLSHLKNQAYYHKEPDEINDYFCRYLYRKEQNSLYVSS